ncbi:hypothetical protein [Nonomuraea solani]|nr:hypothetical protein [Nonomuraea solani]
MGPKFAVACAFSRATGRPVAIGALDKLAQVMDGTSGTRVQLVK